MGTFMRRLIKRVAMVVGVAVALAAVYLGALWFGLFGHPEHAGEVTPGRLPARVLSERADRAGASAPRQILFGDLHVHTTFSGDAFVWSLPLMQGEGAHPPADACDFARFCSGLDFWSINDHAESLTPRRWSELKDSIRQCNEVAGDAASPDLVAFVGWEWTQVGNTPETHYGHKNVIMRETAEDQLPSRPIAAGGATYESFRSSDMGLARLVVPFLDFENRQRYFDLDAFLRETIAVPECRSDAGVRELLDDCIERADTPRELFEKLDDWGHPSIVIPHGTTWGSTAPPGVSWDGQLRQGNHDPDRQRLIEVYSGHGNSEEYRDWRGIEYGPDGAPVCPEPRADYLHDCQRAGEIIRDRCLRASPEAGGGDEAECDRRAAEARQLYVEAGRDGIETVPGQTVEDWLDAGQCRDCFLPAFEYRPGMSVQAALAVRGEGEGFRFGLIASSDNHSARPGTGYKEFARTAMTDQRGIADARLGRFLEGLAPPPAPRARPLDPKRGLGVGGAERMASFWLTGGLVAVHAEGRSRGAIWEGLERREVYGTSGPRILLWFDLLKPLAPMGGSVRMASEPRFRVRAVGAYRQKPGCPDHAVEGLGPERLASLCRGECDHPSDRRHRIARIEVVRIHPQLRPDEPLGELIEDPWQSFACPGDGGGGDGGGDGSGDGSCVIEFSDPEFETAARDALYYVRAVQEPTRAVNAGNLRCRRDAEGRCVELEPCRSGFRSDLADDCLGPVEERAWSSPIFVDYSDESEDLEESEEGST